MARRLVSIIIPTLNEAENLRQLIPAIRRQETTFDVEVLVIDSGSTDATLEVCEEFGVRTAQIPKGTFNHGQTRQDAAALTAGEFLVFTVGDALPADEHWMQRLVEPLLESEQVAGCYGMQVAPDEPLVNPLEKEISLEQGIANELAKGPHAEQDSSGRTYKRVAEGYRFQDLLPFEKRRLASFDNCDSCVRRGVLLDEVPFDPARFGEDYQWAAQVLERGYTVVFEPRAKVFHYHRQGFRYFFNRMWLDQKIVLEVFGLRGHRSLLELFGSWRKEVAASWSGLGSSSGVRGAARVKWFVYNLKLITANRFARYLTEVEGRRHPFGWIANRVERKLGKLVTIRRPI